MLAIVFLILTGCAVHCDNSGNNNYVIEMPHEAARDAFRKPFHVYWNVPTMQCRSKKVPFENLHEKFGIIQNTGDSFRGDKIAILYDPGLFPALLRNETSGQIKFRNGGVPQEGNLEKHLDAFENVLNQSIPDHKFDGVGIIDFESWRPVFRQNFGVLVPYKDVSYDIERKRHWWWINDWIKNEARSRFEHSARTFMLSSMRLARRLRPAASWGYYGFPYCFNGASSTNIEHCSTEVREENDRSHWLWSESTTLFPSVYSSESLDTNQLTAFIRGRVAEAARVATKSTPILPYFWYRYRDGGFLSQKDLKAALQTFYKSSANGIIIWGSSGDVNTVEKCNKLITYINEVMGPAIAKYTKPIPKVEKNPNDSELQNDDGNRTEVITKPAFLDAVGVTSTMENDSIETTTVNVLKTEAPDPLNLWQAPENYEQDVVRYVEEELRRKSGVKQENNDLVKKINETVLLAVVTKAINDQSHGNSDINLTKKIHEDNINSFITTTQVSIHDQASNASEVFIQTSTDNSYTQNTKVDLLSKNNKEKDELNLTENYSKSETYPTSTIDTENYSTQQTETTNNLDNQQYFFNINTFVDNDELISTTEINNDSTTEMYTTESELTTANSNDSEKESEHSKDLKIILVHRDHVARHSRMFVNRDTDDISITDVINTKNEDKSTETALNNIKKEQNENETDLLATSQNATFQVFSSGSAPHVKKHHYFICYFFYFYSVSRCLCDVYQYCT